MQTRNLTELFLSIHNLITEISIYKLQKRFELGFNLKNELDKLNKKLDRSKKTINKYDDVIFNQEVDKPQKELATLIKILSQIIDFLETVPNKARSERYSDIKTQTEELIQVVGQYNTLIQTDDFF